MYRGDIPQTPTIMPNGQLDVDDNINLALGGLDKGISPLEMAGAYATIANDGVYIEPTFYSKIDKKIAWRGTFFV